MESSQLKRITIIGMSILCLSPIEFFSNKLFENNKENNKNIIMASSMIKLKPNYLSNNYEIFNLNDKTTNENLEKLASENKKKDISDSENNLESKTTDEKENSEENEEDNSSENNSEKEESILEESVKKEKNEAEVVKKVEQKTPVNDVKKTTSTENKTTTDTTKKTTSNTEKKEQPQQKTTTAKEEVKTTTTAPAEQEQVVEKPNTDVATSLVNYAKQFVGNPYRYGGSDLYNGTDCSGFTMKVYEHFGYSLPHSSRSQSSYGSYVSIDSLMPGDLIFYGYNGSISHVAIYIGNGQIVHASTSTTGIIISNYQTMPIITARRILK